MGDDEPIFACKRVLEKELEKLQRKLNGPKKTAKHIEAKQNWINRESKRLESEGAKLAEWQESLRVRKETLRVAHEETRFSGGPAERRGTDGQKQEPLHVSGKHRRNSNPRATRIGFLEGKGFEETGWMMEAQRLNKEVEAKKRKLQETIEKESGTDARMGDDSMDGLDGSLSS